MRIVLLKEWLGHPAGSELTVANSMGFRLGAQGVAKEATNEPVVEETVKVKPTVKQVAIAKNKMVKTSIKK